MPVPRPMPVAPAVPIVEVTVLEDRAHVRRAGALVIPGDGTAEVDVVVSVTCAPVLVDKTLHARVTRGRVVAVRCERSWSDHGQGSPGGLGDDVRALTAAHAELLTRLTAREAELAVAGVELAAGAELARTCLAELAEQAAWGRPIDGAEARLATLDQRDHQARARAASLGLAVEELREELTRLEARLGLARDAAGQERATTLVHLRGQPGPVELELDYVVPGAAWRPYHRARLDPGSGQLTVGTDACVWQATGEDWAGVTLRLSTERPSLGAEPPALRDDVLVAQRRTEVMPQLRDQAIASTGLGAAGAAGGRSQGEVPGIDDGGALTALVAPGPAQVGADGCPHRVPLSTVTCKAELALIAAPELSPVVHLRARAVYPGPTPLLAGPVDLVLASGYVGRSTVGFVAAGERFELGFGPVNDLRLHRQHEVVREDAGLLGTGVVTRVRVAVRLSNLGPLRRTVRVSERVPVSDTDQVKVEVSAADGWTLEDDRGRRDDEITAVTARSIDEHGLVHWLVELPPRERRAVALEYRVRSQRGVAGL